MKITKKKEYGYYCDLCGRKICKYLADFISSGGINIYVGKPFDKSKDICHDCARETAEAVLDKF